MLLNEIKFRWNFCHCELPARSCHCRNHYKIGDLGDFSEMQEIEKFFGTLTLYLPNKGKLS